MQLPMFTPKSTWRPEYKYPDLSQAKRICIDVETCDPLLGELGAGPRRGGYIVGIAVAVHNGPSFYYPIRHDGGDNLDEDTILGWMYNEFPKYTGEVVGAKLNYDLDFLAQELITFNNTKRFLDVQLAEPLLNEHRIVYNLNSLANEYLGEGKREDLLNEAARDYNIDPKAEMWKLPARYVGEYAKGDVELPLGIIEKQEKRIEEEGLQDIWDLECDVFPVLFKMSRMGIRIDEGQLEKCHQYFHTEEIKCYRKIKELTGVDVEGDINSKILIGRLIEDRGIKLPRTEKADLPKTDIETLAQFDDEVVNNISRAKKFNKAIGTFYGGVKRHMTGDRLHPEFRQLKSDEGGTVTGRLSSAHPNIQQQPIRNKEIGIMWRSIYVPEEGQDFTRFDYKQQEPRLALHYASKLQGARGAKEAVKRYRENPQEDCYTIVGGKDSDRDQNKEMFLGLTYGMGGAKLCRKLKFETMEKRIEKANGDVFYITVAGPEGSKVISNFHRKAPYIKELAKVCKSEAEGKGYVRTLLGRHCRCPDARFSYKSCNQLIQGSAADQMKKAMVDLHKAGWLPHFQVHDELNFSTFNPECVNSIKRIMENTVKLEVPVYVDVKSGKNWGECK